MREKLERSDTERAIISLLCNNPDLVIEVDGKLDPSDFQNPINKALFKQIVDMYNTGFDKFTQEEFTSIVIRTNEFDAHVIEEYIDVLYGIDITLSNFSKYVDILLDLRLKRELIDSLTSNTDLFNKEVDKHSGKELLNIVQGNMLKLSDSGSYSSGPRDVSEIVRETLEKRLNDKEQNLGIPSPFPELDKYTLGFKDKRLYVVAARANEGKSGFLLNCAINAAYFAKYNRTSVLYLDTEMDEEEWSDRAVSYLSGVNGHVIESGEWDRNERELEAVDKAKETLLKPGHIYFQHVPDFSLDGLTALIRKYVYNYNVGFVVYDYIKLPENYDFSKNEWEIIYSLGRRLKYICKTLKVPILAAQQQNREGDEKSRVTGKALAGGDGVLKECDGMFFLNQKPYKEIEQDGLDFGTHILQIYKLRNGPKSFRGINLDSKPYCFRFSSARKQNVSAAEERIPDKVNAESQIKMLNTAGQYGLQQEKRDS